MFILDIDTQINFGQYKGYDVKYLVRIRPDYLKWIITNFNDLYISPYFIRDASRLNPDIDFWEENQTIIKDAMNAYLYEMTGSDENSDN